jgi:hypothetical protein
MGIALFYVTPFAGALTKKTGGGRRRENSRFYPFFEEVLGKDGATMWWFGGQIVVRCVVSVGKKLHLRGTGKYATVLVFFIFYFIAAWMGRYSHAGESITRKC